MPKTTYNRIKAALAEREKTNKDLAVVLKIAPETVSSWCTNTAQPSIKRLFDIAEFLEMQPCELLVALKKK